MLLLPFAVAPVLLAGCGSSDSAADAAATTSSSSTGSSAASSSSAAPSASADSDAEKKETFCTEVPALLSDISDDLQGVTAAPEQAPALLAEAVDKISAVQPPADAAPQWQRLVTAWTSMRDLLAQADLTNPQANTDLAPQLQSLQTELVDSGTAVDDYGKANC
ncbi:exported protein of unknown function [Modestobacter italicus]|uniref:Uncharacterized protein n=2 Tax=Modestobacter italicus (strain DSM 44449 / CECT 9708 / BC 501) TaxID=2732864 RepID=I4ERJ1_MODI5|nr:exported protein of unknown function [Modestobacter marinus]